MSASPLVRRAHSPRWVVGLRVERLDPALSLRWGFSSAGGLSNHDLGSSSHRGGQCWSLRGRCRRSCGLHCGVGHRGPGCPQRAVGALTRSTLSLGAQSSLPSQLVPPPVSPVSALLWSLATVQAGRTASLSIYEGADGGGPATGSVPGCF